MTKEEKILLVREICTRIPFGLLCTTKAAGWSGTYKVTGYNNDRVYIDCLILDDGDDEWLVESIVPYLRPMSNMTYEEDMEFSQLQTDFYTDGFLYPISASNMVKWLNEHHFDYNNLIKKGLAKAATNEMYGISSKLTISHPTEPMRVGSFVRWKEYPDTLYRVEEMGIHHSFAHQRDYVRIVEINGGRKAEVPQSELVLDDVDYDER